MIKALLLAASLLLPATLHAKKSNTVVLTPKNTIVLNGPVTPQSMSRLKVDLLNKYYSLYKPKVIYLVLDTPGGSVIAGDQFIDFANSLNIEIKTIAIFSASMGFHLIQNLGERLVTESSVLMSHRASLQLRGELYGEFDSRLGHIRATIDRLDNRIAKRMELSLPRYQYVIRDELWVDGPTAIKIKAADRNVNVQCGRELKGTRTKVISTMFGSMKVKVHACPLITTPLDVDTSNIKNRYVAKALKMMYTDREKFVKRYITNPEGYQRLNNWLY
jgi:ATP-dependent protease ClpP protease subunit